MKLVVTSIAAAGLLAELALAQPHARYTVADLGTWLAVESAGG